MQPDNILTRSYLEKHPQDAARILENFPYSMSAQLLEQLSPNMYIAAFQFLMPSYAANLLAALQGDKKTKLINTLSSEQLSVLLKFFDESNKNSILAEISSDKRSAVVRHLQYPLETVGTIMGPPANSMPNDITTAEALKRIKNSKKRYASDIFIIDRSQQYHGVVTLDRLIKSPSNTRLETITDSSLLPLSTRKSLHNLTSDPAWSTTLILPVIDSRGTFAGVLKYIDLQQYSMTVTGFKPPQKAVDSSVLELIFQALAVLLEGLGKQLLPMPQSEKFKDTHYDNRS